MAKRRVILLLLLALAPVARGADAPAKVPPTTRPAAVTLPDKSHLHLYLMMGQSNMAGRGAVGEEDRTPHPRVLVLTADEQWEPAIEPITRDRKTGLGVGPGLAFGKATAERDPNVTIGLVPCAVGGTPLSRWEKGGDLYANAVRRAKLAAGHGTLKGVIWHQGENDAAEEDRAKTYGERLARAVRDFREDLGAPELPFVAGQLGEFLYTRTGDKSPFARVINDALVRLPDAVPHSACVRSTGLGHKGDELHFDAPAERELGRRFAAEMMRLQGKRAE